MPSRLVLYARRDCHLCDEARASLERLRSDRLDFELEEVDITGDSELEPRYRERIPVVLVDGKEAFTYFVTPDGLRRRVES